MKTTLLSLAAFLALALSAGAADFSVKLTDVHVCCDNCVKAVQAIIAKVDGVTGSANSEESTISLAAADKAKVQKAVDQLVAAGFFGVSSSREIKVNAETGAKNRKVQSLQVEGVHLCCTKCVKSVNRVLESVSGVKTNTAAKDAKTFLVIGDFNDKEMFTALQKAGLTGKVGKP